MEVLEINKENALNAYQEADKKGKDLLTNLFGRKVFITNVIEQMKTFDDACEILGIINALPVKNPSSNDEKAVNAFWQLNIIAKALNQGWEPNWKNSSEYKYYPYFEAKKSGFGFSDACYVRWAAGAFVGSRLCFKTRELAEYAGKQFEDLYNQMFTL